MSGCCLLSRLGYVDSNAAARLPARAALCYSLGAGRRSGVRWAERLCCVMARSRAAGGMRVCIAVFVAFFMSITMRPRCPPFRSFQHRPRHTPSRHPAACPPQASAAQASCPRGAHPAWRPNRPAPHPGRRPKARMRIGRSLPLAGTRRHEGERGLGHCSGTV